MGAYEEKYLMVFHSGNQAMLLYNALLKEGCRVKIVSTPCRLSRGCSQSIVFDASDSQKIVQVAKSHNIVAANVYKIVINQGRRDYVPL
jgi:hypothetical protein